MNLMAADDPTACATPIKQTRREQYMPIISTFYGIIIQIYWDDHAPPHFHARYAEDQIIIDIRTLGILKGKMSRRALMLVLEWAQEHRDELMEDWELCQRNQSPNKISPLL